MPADPAEALRARGLRVTPQRRAILAAFRDRPEEHLSADEVHARAAAVVPEVGRGTVYATLAELTELGLLAAFGAAEPVRYETNTADHAHFRCKLCLRLFDVDLAPPPAASLEREGYAVERITIVAEGICRACREYERGLEDGVTALATERQVDDTALGTIACAEHATPLGAVMLAASADGMVRVAFPEHADFDLLAARARTRRGPRAARAHLEHGVAAIDAYFAGGRDQVDETVDWAIAPVAGAESLAATRRVPYGATRSYDRLGTPADPYDIGFALGTNPMPFLFPCHRVTRGEELPLTYVGGLERRAALVALEGS